MESVKSIFFLVAASKYWKISSALLTQQAGTVLIPVRETHSCSLCDFLTEMNKERFLVLPLLAFKEKALYHLLCIKMCSSILDDTSGDTFKVQLKVLKVASFAGFP